MHTISILCSVADTVSLGNWPILFKVLTLNVNISTVFLLLSNFGLDLSLTYVTDFSNTGARSPTSAKRSSCFLARRAMQLGHMA